MVTARIDSDNKSLLAGTNKFELLLFHLGEAPSSGQRELFGINVFKVREILVMPAITEMANSNVHMMGVANIRGQIIPVINLPAVMGCKATKGLNILMVTEFGRTVQAFAVEDVREIVQIEWSQIIASEDGKGAGMVTGIARIDGMSATTRLAQVVDVEQVLSSVIPKRMEDIDREVVGPELVLPEGAILIAADDSAVARSVIELGLKAMGIPYAMARTGQEAWDRMEALADEAQAQGTTAAHKIAVVLTDLEMPEMDGFTLTRKIKADPRFNSIPVVIHSSLTGSTNENHVKSVGADAYVAKFAPRELAITLRRVLGQ